MRKISAIFLILASFAGPAGAHQDRIVHVESDGAMPDIPARFGQARLILEGLGSDKPLIQLRIGANQTTLPLCVARMIRTTRAADIRVTGSWDRDKRASLPDYLNIQFLDPGRDPKRRYNSSHEFLFDLHNAGLIDAKVFESSPAGNGGRFSALKLPAGCELNVNGIKEPAASETSAGM
jgi:hypothetical protein